MAGRLSRDGFEVDYFFSKPVPVLGSPYQLPLMDSSRLAWMQTQSVRLVEYHLQAIDAQRITNNWIKTDFWSLFDAAKYELIQVAKAGPMEYPFYLLNAPVVEFLSLGTAADKSPNIVWSIHCSEWQRQAWLKRGGAVERSSVISNPVFPIASTANLRDKLGIPKSAVVAGFHQRAEEHIVSRIPLQAFAETWEPERHFILMGGGEGYRRQASEIGLKNVHFLPHRGDVVALSQFLNTLDIYAHGRADGETFGTVLAEALMHGKPCLTHFVEGSNNAQAETIGPAGVCVRSVAEYADWLNKLYASADLRQQFAALATPLARQWYSEEMAVNKLASLYRALISKQSLTSFVLPQPKNQDSQFITVPKSGKNAPRPIQNRNGIMGRILIALSHPRLSTRNAASKLYHAWVRKTMPRKLRRHPFFLHG